MKIKKLTAILLVCTLIFGTAGCNTTKEENGGTTGSNETSQSKKSQEPVAMGRYVEENLELPASFKDYLCLGFLSDPQGEYHLFMQDMDGRCIEYVMAKDGTWREGDAGWLNEVTAKLGNDIRTVQCGDDGTFYTVCYDADYTQWLIRKTEEGSQTTKLPVDDGEISTGCKITQNGDILVSIMGGDAVLYKEDGTEVRRFEQGHLDIDGSDSYLDVEGNQMVTMNSSCNGFFVYDLDTGEKLGDINVDFDINDLTGMNTVKFKSKDDFVYLDSKGLHHFQTQGTIMETIIDGSLNSMGIAGFMSIGLILGEQDDYYVLFKDDTDYQLSHYTYDPNVASVPQEELTVFALEESDIISRAIGRYQIEHPDVHVIFHTAQSAEGSISTADSIRTLNTELLNGKGADILILDGLPVESYIEKGVLEDISDIINPMIERGELLENVMKTYGDGSGPIYGTPVRISVPILYGNAEVIGAMTSLDSLKSYLDANPESDFISYPAYLNYNTLLKFLLCINYKELTSGGKLTKDSLIKYLNTAKAASDAIGAAESMSLKNGEDEAEWIASITEMFAQGFGFDVGAFPLEKDAAGKEVKGMTDLMDITTMKSDYGQSYQPVNGYFISKGTIGINHSSSQIGRAKEFISLLLSEEEQNKDLGNGFPVNYKALENWCEKTSTTSMGVYFEAGDGELLNLSMDYPNSQEIQEFVDIIKSLDQPLNIDQTFREMILDEAEKFLSGSTTAEKAADAILSKANTYLSE